MTLAFRGPPTVDPGRGGGLSTDLQLLAIDGDIDPGTTFNLYPEEPLAIGRSSRGLQLHDPLVSIQHARIEWQHGRGYVVTDLDSATGTWVDEECIQNASRPIGVGTKLRFGETIFQVQNRRRYPVWLSWVMAATLVFGLVSLALTIWLRSQPVAAPDLLYKEPIRQGNTSSATLAVPRRFARRRGIDITSLKIRRVTDYDYDGIDEVWLRDGDEAEYVITFAPDGSWADLGSLPAGCHDRSMGAPGTVPEQFPALDCKNEHYLFTDGQYRLVGHDGVVVWAEWKEPRKKAPEPGAHGEAEAPPAAVEPLIATEGITPIRVVLKEPSRLAGLLADRGVTEPVHYVICEDAFRGLRAQVLTQSGEIRALSPGCLGNLKFTNPAAGRPIAMATTAWGRKALVDDLNVFYAGSPDGLFLEAEHQETLEQAAASPGFARGDVKVTVDFTPIFVDPLPKADEPLPTGRRPIPRDQRVEVAAPAVSHVVSVQGTAEVAAGGCAKLRVYTEPFLCTGLCSGDFIRVEEVGCGPARPVLSVDYDGGTVDGIVDDLHVRAVVETGATGVLRARLGWRNADK